MAVPAISRGTVLVVEDEYLIRMAATDFFEAAGYRAVEAANADEAIAILEARDDIHIVFTDINMPGSMDGLKLAHAIRGRWPPIKLIVTSGRGLPRDACCPEGAVFVDKPYHDSELGDALRRVGVA